MQRSITIGKLLRHRCCSAEVFYFVFSSEMENRTLSQMCGRLYLPMFLLRVGLLTLMYIASFYGPGHILNLPAYYFEVFHCCCVASNILMLKSGDSAFKEVLIQCKYPKWAIDRVLQKQEDRRTENRRNQVITTPTKQEENVT